jgi:hypothetical protein
MRHSVLHNVRYDRYMGGYGLLDAGIPWLSVGAITALETYILNPDILRRESPEMRDARLPKRVLELGSGGSTIFWARRVDHVRSYETDPKWAPATLEALRTHGLAEKVELRAVTHAEALVDVPNLPDGSFDLMLVDHADPTIRHGRRVDRLPLALAGVPKLRSGGWLVIDNHEMHGMQHFPFTDDKWERNWIFADMRYSGGGTSITRKK